MTSKFQLLVVAVLAIPAAAAAQGSTAPASIELSPDSSMQAVVSLISGTRLELQSALEAAVRNSVATRTASAALEAALGVARRERGGFDPVLTGGLSRSGSTLPNISIFQSGDKTQSVTTAGNLGAGVQLPTGGQLSLGFSGSSTSYDPVSISNPVSPLDAATGSLSLVQPLLKGLGPAAFGARTAANFDLKAARNSFEDAVSLVRAQTEQTYWSLYAAERDYAAQRLARDQAAAFFKQTDLRASAGRGGPSQLASSRVFLAQQEQSLLDKEEAMDDVSDQLSTLMGRASPEHARYLTTSEPPREFPVEDEDSLVARAVRRNRFLAASRRHVDAVGARVRAARWKALPQLDFVGSIGGNGLSGTGNSVSYNGQIVPAKLEGDFSDATSQVRNRLYPTWNYGLVLSVPLSLRRNSGERDRADAELAQAEESYRGARYSIEDQVRTARRALLHAADRLKAARSGVDAALEQVRIGQLQYNVGLVTAFELVRLRADLATAQQSYSQALVRASTASAALRHLVPAEELQDE
jgi:outer membrane protein TolC